jgi:hypothetical protein
MNRRRIAAAGAVAILAVTSCGGDGSKTLSEKDFLSELTDICKDAKRSLDQIDGPTDLSETEQFAAAVSDVYTATLDRLKALNPPKDYTTDFTDFVDVIGETGDQLVSLGKAAKKEDQAKVDKVMTKLTAIADDQVGLADNLGVSDCGEEQPATETTVADTTPATEAPTTTGAPAPLTLPPTLPPATASPTATDPPTGAQLFSVMDLATEYNAPSGFTLVSKTPDQGTLDAVANSDLNILMEKFGVATLVDSNGTEVADIWIGLALLADPGMPAAWKDLDCGSDGQLRTSAGGILGIYCPALADSPFYEIFTATAGAIGISVYTRLPDIGGDLVADAFIGANP